MGAKQVPSLMTPDSAMMELPAGVVIRCSAGALAGPGQGSTLRQSCSPGRLALTRRRIRDLVRA